MLSVIKSRCIQGGKGMNYTLVVQESRFVAHRV